MIQTVRKARAQFDIVFVPPGFVVSKNLSKVAAADVIDSSASIISRTVRSANNNHVLETKRAETCPDRRHEKANVSLIEPPVLKPQKKVVRFATDSKTRRKVKCEYFGDNIPPLDISPRETNPIWYCPAEFDLFKKEAKRIIGSQLGGRAECQKKYLLLYRLCASAQEMRQISLPQSAAFCVSQSRGLEKLVFSKCTLSGNVVRSVIQEQKTLLRAGVKNATLPLARFCMSQSAPARRMARVLGAGDEHVARDDSYR